MMACKLGWPSSSQPVEIVNYSSIHGIALVSRAVRQAEGLDSTIIALQLRTQMANSRSCRFRRPKQANRYATKRCLHDSMGKSSALGGPTSAVDHYVSSTATLTSRKAIETDVPDWSLN